MIDYPRLLALYHAGHTDAEIVAQTHWSRSSVQYARAVALKLPVSPAAAAKLSAQRAAVVVRNRRKIDVAAFTALHAQGATDRELADRFRVTPAAALKTRARLALPLNPSALPTLAAATQAAAARLAALRAAELAQARALLLPDAPYRPGDITLLTALACGPLDHARAALARGVTPGTVLHELTRLRRAGVVNRARNPASPRKWLWTLAPAVASTFSPHALTPLQQRVAASPRALALADHAAASYALKLPHLSDDIRSAAYAGLADAALRFDPTRFQFATFAQSRVRGAIQDALRAAAPKGYRRAADDIPGMEPDAEVATTALPIGWELESLDAVHAATATLPAPERAVLRLYYGHCLTLCEVGARLNLSESRASQLHTSGLAALRVRLAA